MEFDHNKVRRVVEEDRLSSLPDDLIHKIMSCFDMKFAVHTCLLSSRWKLLWTSMPCLNLSSWHFGTLPNFEKFVTNVLTHHNHQRDVSSVKLHLRRALNEVFVRKFADYIFSHNVQELTVSSWPKTDHQFPLSLFSSQSLKKFTLRGHPYCYPPCVTPKTPWDFPALTTLHLCQITLCDDNTRESVDLFSKCVNLKNLTLDYFCLGDVKVFDIVTPRLSNLILTHGKKCSAAINLIAPQLENLTVIDCSINNLNAPPGLSSLCYRDQHPMQLFEDGFHSLNKVTIFLNFNGLQYKEEDARKTINMLQGMHSARFITLSINVVECLSTFPDLLLHHPSPFSNLICLTIDSIKRNDAYKVNMSTEARNFFLENSPNATFNFIME